MFFRVFLCILLFGITASAQPPRPLPHEEKKSLIKVAASPDALTIAIARSGNTSVKRYGRVELWNAVTGKLLRTITGFDGPVWSLTFSRDGKSVITVSTEHREQKVPTKVRDRNEKVFVELKWWNVQSGEFIRKSLVETEERVASVQAAWSPNGEVLALIERYALGQLTIPDTGFRGRLISQSFEIVHEVNLKLLDAQTGERRVKVEDASRSLSGYQGFVYARLYHPTFSPDGNTLSAVFGSEVILWNARTGKKLSTLKKVKGDPVAIAFSPDSRTVAVASIRGRMPGGESEITVWEVPTGREVNRLKGRNDEISSLQFAPDGRALLIGSLQYERAGATGTVKMWNLVENRLGRLNVRDGKPVSSFILLADQSVVLQSDEDVELWDAKTWEVKYSFEPSEEGEDESNRRSRLLLSAKRAVAVAFSRDGLTVSAEIPGEGVRHWDSRTGGVKSAGANEATAELADKIADVKTGDVTDKTADVKDKSEGEEKVASEQAADAVVAMSANGDFRADAIATGVRLTDVGKGTVEEIKFSGDGPIGALALSTDGQLLAIATGDQIAVLKMAGKAPAVTFAVGQEITAVAIDPSGQLLAVARADRSIVFWSLKTGSMQGELRKHQDVINALAFSPDGRTLASGGDDRTAILWEVASGKTKRTLKGHDVTVTSLAFSPDGRLLASGSGNAAVVLWDVASGKLDRILR